MKFVEANTKMFVQFRKSVSASTVALPPDPTGDTGVPPTAIAASDLCSVHVCRKVITGSSGRCALYLMRRASDSDVTTP